MAVDTPKLSIGDSGIFTLKEPFKALITPQTVYSVLSLRRISDVIASGGDPYKLYYAQLDISETDYQTDALANVCIVGLQSGVGSWVYVPESYIDEVPTVAGIKYTSVVIGVSLGAIPDDTNIEALAKGIGELAQASVGVIPTVKAVVMSQPAYLSHEKAARLEAARTAKIMIQETDFARANRLEAELHTANNIIANLEDIIKKKR